MRGLAVLLVVFYHAKVGFVTSGYIGVDVFLVISGFLITKIVFGQIDQGSFNAAVFLSRRLRRLMPAAILMVATTLFAALFFVSPNDLETLAASCISVFVLAANLFFWGRQNYFADRVPQQPLLHTWSLGVEEQFYLLFPFFLLAIAAYAPRLRATTFILCAAFLFSVGFWMTGSHPGAAFYLLPSRAWEFLLGGLVALLAERVTAPRWVLETAAGAGLVGILVAAVGFLGTTPYPGVAALLPVSAASCLIWANGNGPHCNARTMVGTLLGGRILVAVGVASYSLYLWHWPVLTLARYFAGRDLRAVETVAALAMISLVAFVSWAYVEQPFRLFGDAAKPRRPLTPILVVGFGVVVAAVATLVGHGFPGRLSSVALGFASAGESESRSAGACHDGPADILAPTSLCVLAPAQQGHPKVLLWGDSHANALAPALAALGRANGYGVLQATHSSCPPLLGAKVAHVHSVGHCLHFNDMALRAVQSLGIERVVLAAYWSAYLPVRADPAFARFFDPFSRSSDLGGGDDAANERNFSTALNRTVSTLTNLGVEVWIVRQIPAQESFVPLTLARAASFGQDYKKIGISLVDYRMSQAKPDALFDALGGSVRLIDPAIALCPGSFCLSDVAERSLYIDGNHLSRQGAVFVEHIFAEVFH